MSRNYPYFFHGLVVQADADLAQQLANTLDSLHLNTGVVSTYQEALAFIKQHQPNVICLDLFLLENHAWEVIAEIHAQYEKDAIPVILTTAYHLPGQSKTCKGSQPYDTAAFSDMVQRLLGSRLVAA